MSSQHLQEVIDDLAEELGQTRAVLTVVREMALAAARANAGNRDLVDFALDVANAVQPQKVGAR